MNDFTNGQPKAKSDKEIQSLGDAYYRAKKDVEQVETDKRQAEQASILSMKELMIQQEKSQLMDIIAQIKIAQKVLESQMMPMLPQSVGAPANGLPASVGPPANGMPPLPVSGPGNIPAPQDMGGGGMPQGMGPVPLSSAPPYQ
jgi:hypothetical protein